MRVIEGNHRGDLRVEGYVGVSGRVDGNVYVESGRLTLTGEITGDLVVHEGVANLFGVVGGDVVNHAGEIVLGSETPVNIGSPGVGLAGPAPRRWSKTAPWKYAGDSANPRLRLQRWRRFVTAVVMALVALVILGAALYFGSRVDRDLEVYPTGVTTPVTSGS